MALFYHTLAGYNFLETTIKISVFREMRNALETNKCFWFEKNKNHPPKNTKKDKNKPVIKNAFFLKTSFLKPPKLKKTL